MADRVGDDLVPDGAREARLAGALARVRAEGARRLDHRALAVLAGVLVPVGIVLVLIGWRGAARTPNVYEQVPYLISGAELGQTLALVGALCYFAYWLSVLVREQRAQSDALLDALRRVEQAIAAPAGAGPAGPGGRLVATAGGRLAHRPDCSAVAGRTGLRTVTPADGLARCRLCQEPAD